VGCEEDAQVAARTRAERERNGRIGAYVQWSREPDRTARTAKARAASPAGLDRFEREVDPDGVLPTDVRAKMAEAARKAYFLKLSLKSAKARAAKKGGGGAAQ
jgi:hypothetical protein